ncbi:glycine-rich domain-containing protein [Actinomycetota bacterium Odt1-20B]
MATVIDTPTLEGRDLVDPALFKRLTDFCAAEYGLEACMAERIMDEGLAFLDTMGRSGEPLSPSRQVDPAWHTFMLHSAEYTEWCMQRYGRYMHHAPNSRYRDRSAMVDVTSRIRALGYDVDDSLWGVAAECNEPACCGDGPCC